MDNMVVAKQKKKTRMQSLECCRLLGSFIVVFAHCAETYDFALLISYLGRFAVPFFFMVSGYFTYNVSEKTLRKRLWGAIKLTVIANILYWLWDGYCRGLTDFAGLVGWLIDKCSSNALSKMLLISKSPFRSHLWYLHAMVPALLIIWIYVRWQENETCNYKPLYITGVCLYSLHVVLGSFATASEFAVPYHIYRNALLYGLPMITLGIFLREYQEKIIRVYKLTKTRLIGLVILGAFLSLLQQKGTGEVEMPVGVLVEAMALMLLMVVSPTISRDSVLVSRMISTFGALSTYIYITHMVWADVYKLYLEGYILRLGEVNTQLVYPVSVLVLSLVTGTLYMKIKSAMKWLVGKMKPAVSAGKG